MHEKCSGLRGILEKLQQNFRKTSFSPLFVFLLSRISGSLWSVGGSLASLDWSC